MTRPSSAWDASGSLGDELGDQPIHQLGQTVRRAFDLRFGPRAPPFDREQRRVERHVTAGAYDAPEQELAGAEPASQAERGALGEVVLLRAHGLPPRGHHRPWIGRARAALAGEPRGHQVDHPFAQVAQLRGRASHAEGDDGDQVGVERDGRVRPPQVSRQNDDAARGPRPRGRRSGDGRGPPASGTIRPSPRGVRWRAPRRRRPRSGSGRRAPWRAPASRCCSTPSGTAARTVRSGGTGSIAWRARSCWAVAPLNGGWPASISYSTQPSAYRSLRPSRSRLAGGLLRAHVRGRAEGEAGLGEPAVAGGGDGPRHPEVRHHRLVPFAAGCSRA